MDSTRYAYSVGRVRAIESKMLDRSGFEKMIEARTVEDAVKVLMDAGYEDEISGFAEYAFEKILQKEKRKLYGLLYEISPEPEMYQLFLIKNDYHNLKVLLKAEFSGQEADSFLLDTGLIPADKIKVMVRERNFGQMHDIMKNAINEALEIFNHTQDPQLSDIILDNARFRHMKSFAEKLDNRFVDGLIELLIDSVNIKTFIRCKKLGKSRDFIKRVIIPYGSIDQNKYLSAIDASVEELSTRFGNTRYGKVVEKGIAGFASTGKMSYIEKAFDEYTVEYVNKAKYVAIGPEPMIRYIFIKEYEIMNAGIILAGKSNNISNDVIRERLREYYA